LILFNVCHLSHIIYHLLFAGNKIFFKFEAQLIKFEAQLTRARRSRGPIWSPCLLQNDI